MPPRFPASTNWPGRAADVFTPGEIAAEAAFATYAEPIPDETPADPKDDKGTKPDDEDQTRNDWHNDDWGNDWGEGRASETRDGDLPKSEVSARETESVVPKKSAPIQFTAMPGTPPPDPAVEFAESAPATALPPIQSEVTVSV